jgi:CHAT domain-containing protein
MESCSQMKTNAKNVLPRTKMDVAIARSRSLFKRRKGESDSLKRSRERRCRRFRCRGRFAATSRVSVDAQTLEPEDCRTSTTIPWLWNVDQELTHIESVVKASALECTVETIARATTVDWVTSCIPSAHFVHLACHGTQHPTAALESGFHLSDETLTVSKLMSLDLKQAWFAYLSACETAKGDTKQPDQGIHLAAAMLFAGFKSVVATMWYAELVPRIPPQELT